MAFIDCLQPFQIEGTPVQGRFVRLKSSLSTILSQHAYPKVVGTFLGELTTLTAALSGGMKEEHGLLTAQVKGEGPIHMAVSDATSSGHLRGFAQFDSSQLALLDEGAQGRLEISRYVGEGYLIMTTDPGPYGERYQGVVSLQGKNLAECLQSYFRQSEQLTGALKVDIRSEGDSWVSGALLLQKTPGEGGKESSVTALQKGEEEWEIWYETLALLGSLSSQELLDVHLSAEDLLYRLFHQRGVRLFEPRPLKAQCRCSEDRARNLVSSFSLEDKEHLSQEGVISIRCEFCNQEYKIPC